MQRRDQDFFKPLWRRIAITAVCVVWFVYELTVGEQMWLFMSGGVTAYAVWTFFITFKADDDPAEGDDPAE